STEQYKSPVSSIITSQRFVVNCILSVLLQIFVCKILQESHLKYQLFSLHLHRLFFLSLASFQASQTEKGSFISVIFSTALLMHYWKILLACSYIYGHLSWKLYVVAAVFFVYQKSPSSHYGHKHNGTSFLLLLQITSFSFYNLDNGH